MYKLDIEGRVLCWVIEMTEFNLEFLMKSAMNAYFFRKFNCKNDHYEGFLDQKKKGPWSRIVLVHRNKQ